MPLVDSNRPSNTKKSNIAAQMTRLLSVRWSLFALWSYLLCCAVSLGSAYLVLSRAEAKELRVLSAGTLFYVSKDRRSADVARWAKSALGVHTIDLLSPEAGGQLYALTGERQAASPTLVLKRDGQKYIESGPFAVRDAFLPATSRDAPMQRGQRALFMMAGLIVLVCAFSTEVSAMAGLVALVGAVALTMLQSHCLNCEVGVSPVAGLTPLLGSAYVVAGALLFTFPVLRRREAYVGLLLVSGIVPGVQALLLCGEPKFCPACLAITFVSAAYFVACLKTLASGRLTGTASPLWFKWAVPAVLVALTVRHSLVAFGAVSTAKPQARNFMVPRIVGTPFSHFVSLPNRPQPGVLYIVTQAGCGACAAAKSDLTQAKISWREVPVCSSSGKQGCFGGMSDYITPMLLICDANGRVAFQRDGWVTQSADRIQREQEIVDAQRRLMPKQ